MSVGTRTPRERATADDSPNMDQVILRLKEIERRTGLERTLAIGELVLTQFFDGNAAAWRARSRNKDSSIRRLANHTGCPFGKSALHEAIGVYVAVRELPSVRTSGHITASHIASVLRLASSQRQGILEQAERERWGVRQLRQAVVKLRRAEGERRGRPAEMGQVRALSALRVCVRSANQALTRMHDCGPLSARVRAEMSRLAQDTSQLLLELTNLANSA